MDKDLGNAALRRSRTEIRDTNSAPMKGGTKRRDFFHGRLGQALALLVFLGGCDAVSDLANGTTTKGGASGSGGKAASAGGSLAKGGNAGTASSGGAPSATGGSGAGGATAGSTGGAAGDAPATGGTFTGGNLGSGGSANGGGTALGGSSASGGASTTGGATAPGGTTAKGGTEATGGSTGTGGVAGTGGTTSAGGATATGGATGAAGAPAMTCTSCHGSGTNPAPPSDTEGNTATTAAGVGAHAQHLAASTWHRQGQCRDCHILPTSNDHADGKVDFTWGAPSNAGGAAPAFNTTSLSCSGTYCHGTKMKDQAAAIIHAPVWNKVDGTQDACGKACHANPPASSPHTASSTACQTCHGDVISSFNGANSTWKNASLHINGKVESTMTCASCHGNPPNGGTHTRESRHRTAACTACHPSSSSSTHQNGSVNVTCGSNQAGCHDDD